MTEESDSIITAPEIKEEFKSVQEHICKFLVRYSGEHYKEDNWNYDKGEGGGRSRIWEDGAVLEKAGVNFSYIEGTRLAPSAADKFEINSDVGFIATGVSLVIHPRNPHIPTIHLNIRYFETRDGKWWFGGGVDLTPYYPRFRDCVAFHRKLQEFCERYGEDYEKHKKRCDDYFYLAHRNEARGIGGLFLEHMNVDRKRHFVFMKDLGYLFTELYQPFLEQYLNASYSEEERCFQLWRRSRYVEFNLLWDRGTKFGIESKGRTESILMSLPSVATWRYNYKPEEGSYEALVLNYFMQPQDWAHMDPSNPPDICQRQSSFSMKDKFASLFSKQTVLPMIDRLHFAAVGAVIGIVLGRTIAKYSA
eukprot:gb/GECH01000528.1/.p1 GENE.gb/GECH01000528.1/~~gb/GECH01000528.1/.p1  ORF type:complete len:363 (+),score=81.55 gb/GECH01000528.1/:1-1089(+)